MLQKRKCWIILTIITCILVGIVCFLISNFSVQIYHVSAQQTVEYGTEYQKEEPDAVFVGKIVGKDEKTIPVTTEGTVDTQKLGEYEIVYRAQHFLWKKEVKQVVKVQDTTPPVISLTKKDGYYVLPGGEYEEEGFVATDSYDGDLTKQVVVTQENDTIVYTVKDQSGNEAKVTRNIPYDDPIAPEITLQGSSVITITKGTKFSDPGCKASDNVDGDLTERIQTTGNVDTGKPGTYTIQYEVKDSFDNVSKVERTVIVKDVQSQETVIPSGKVIYLTFDDGPGPYTETLLNTLKKYNVKATFFVVNGKYNHIMKRIVNEGHAIGMHSVTHNYAQIYKSTEAFFNDLTGMQKIIYDQTGVRPTIMRFPGGSSNAVSKKYCKGIMTTLTNEVVSRGFQYFDWNVTSGDAGETKSTDQVVRNVINGVSGRQYAVVLQHDIKQFSVNAVEKIITWGLNQGYTFQALDRNSPAVHHGVNN